MKKYYSISLFVLLATTLFFNVLGQDNVSNSLKIDSLQKKLATSPHDTNRVKLLANLADVYTNYDSAVLYARQGIALAEKINFPEGEAACFLSMGNAYAAILDEFNAIESYQKSLEIYERLDNKNGIYLATGGPARIFYLEKDFRRELRVHFKLAELAKKINSVKLLAISVSNIGNTYYNLGQLDSAEIYLRKEIVLSRNFADSIGVSVLADVLTEKGKFNEALVYLHQSLSLYIKINDEVLIGECYNLLAKAYIKSNQTDSAFYYANKYFEFANKFKDFVSLERIATSGKQLSLLYERKKNYEKSLHFYKLAKDAEDSLIAQERISKLSAFSYRSKQREREKIAAEREYRNRVFLYASLTGVIVFLLIAVILYRNNRQKQKAFVELKATQAQLIQSEKMASLGELTAGIAHEIQNPLNFVNNFSEVNTELIDEASEEMDKGNISEAKIILNDIKENEQKIIHHGKRADAIVKGMLQHSRVSTGQKELTDINALADEYLRLSYHGLRAKDKTFNATLQTDFDNSIGKINIGPQDIGRVLLNLFNNAFYAVLQKKKDAQENYEPTITVTTKKENNKVSIVVRDNGNGIPQKVLDKIFQPFFTTKPTGQGTGLGLSLSYDIIKAHGGEIKVETDEGHGSTFIIQLSPNQLQ